MKGGDSMPNRDGTGPEGKGPKTGRGMGNCAGDKPREASRGMGLGLGKNRGQGRRQSQVR